MPAKLSCPLYHSCATGFKGIVEGLFVTGLTGYLLGFVDRYFVGDALDDKLGLAGAEVEGDMVELGSLVMGIGDGDEFGLFEGVLVGDRLVFGLLEGDVLVEALGLFGVDSEGAVVELALRCVGENDGDLVGDSIGDLVVLGLFEGDELGEVLGELDGL